MGKGTRTSKGGKTAKKGAKVRYAEQDTLDAMYSDGSYDMGGHTGGGTRRASPSRYDGSASLAPRWAQTQRTAAVRPAPVEQPSSPRTGSRSRPAEPSRASPRYDSQRPASKPAAAERGRSPGARLRRLERGDSDSVSSSSSVYSAGDTPFFTDPLGRRPQRPAAAVGFELAGKPFNASILQVLMPAGRGHSAVVEWQQTRVVPRAPKQRSRRHGSSSDSDSEAGSAEQWEVSRRPASGLEYATCALDIGRRLRAVVTPVHAHTATVGRPLVLTTERIDLHPEIRAVTAEMLAKGHGRINLFLRDQTPVQLILYPRHLILEHPAREPRARSYGAHVAVTLHPIDLRALKLQLSPTGSALLFARSCFERDLVWWTVHSFAQAAAAKASSKPSRAARPPPPHTAAATDDYYSSSEFVQPAGRASPRPSARARPSARPSSSRPARRAAPGIYDSHRPSSGGGGSAHHSYGYGSAARSGHGSSGQRGSGHGSGRAGDDYGRHGSSSSMHASARGNPEGHSRSGQSRSGHSQSRGSRSGARRETEPALWTPESAGRRQQGSDGDSTRGAKPTVTFALSGSDEISEYCF